MGGKCVVRVREECYKRGDSYFLGKSVRVIKHLSTIDIMRDEVNNIGIDEAMNSITNLHEVSDGLYMVVFTDRTYDFESGAIDGYNLKLVFISQ